MIKSLYNGILCHDSLSSEDRMRISDHYENTVRFLHSRTIRSNEFTEVPRSLMLLSLIHHKILDEALDLDSSL